MHIPKITPEEFYAACRDLGLPNTAIAVTTLAQYFFSHYPDRKKYCPRLLLRSFKRQSLAYVRIARAMQAPPPSELLP